MSEAEQPLQELRLTVPTYYGEALDGKHQEWDAPHVPVLVQEAEGVRIVLGSHDYDDCAKPDVQIERRKNGWAIFLHPIGGADPCGYVYFLDDGRSLVHPEHAGTPEIELSSDHDAIVKELDGELNPELNPLL